MEQGSAVESSVVTPWISAPLAPVLGVVPQFWLHPDDITPALTDHPDPARMAGCCGPTGLAGPNQICRRCKTPIGVLQDDCITPRVFIPDLSAVIWAEDDVDFLPWPSSP